MKDTWEEILGAELSVTPWECAIDRTRSTTSCARLSLIQFNDVHFSKSKHSEVYPEVQDKCDKGTCFYCVPTRILDFWTSSLTLSTILGVNLQPCPLITVFWIPDVCYTELNTEGYYSLYIIISKMTSAVALEISFQFQSFFNFNMYLWCLYKPADCK